MTFSDQMGRTIKLDHWPPRRIISLVPSQTEFLADLGLEKEVVGITKFCVHPAEWFQQKKRVGGTKTLDFQKIDVLKPDLIIGNKEENEQSQIEFLAQHYPVWMSDIYTLEDALDMMRKLGELTGKTEKANAIAAEVDKQFKPRRFLKPTRFGEEGAYLNCTPKVAYFIWRKPYMAAGSGTFIDDMLRRASFENVFGNLARYPEISEQQLADAQPDAIFLSSEPYPFSEKHVAGLQEICPAAQIQLVDGELFSWYGSRLLQAPDYFAALREKLDLK
ncbi:MAG: ABC transporter substrate-binding protein [Phycisphaerae bacterium]|nr:ABC transporter substrate-binding protein [Saprospiraceae bacterium]